MTPQDREAIVALAIADRPTKELLDEAIDAHRRCIATDGVRGNIYQMFMAEIDNICPDLALRSEYRKKVIIASKSKA